MINMAQMIRTDKSIVGRWWWSVDRWALSAILLLSVIGVVMVAAASPPVAALLKLNPFHFVYRHVALLIPALGMMLAVSMLERKLLWRLAVLTLGGAIILMVGTILFGSETKGATRWIRIFGFSLQPSEFVKPAFAVVSAWLISQYKYHTKIPGHMMATGLFGIILCLLLLQPDLGMSLVMSSIWAAQIFLAGLPLIWVFLLAGIGCGGLFAAYMFFPHVSSRIDRFLDPASGDNYQVQKSLDAFANGGFFGTGPGHGQVKMNLPDAHADFIFSVAGEEFGFIAAVFIVLVFCFIIWRSITRITQSDDFFVVLAAGGLLTQFALQSLIHMGSSLQLLPAKGMTLPFISYGGSSLLSLAFGMGALLALTRRRTPTTSTTMWRKFNAGESYG